MCGVAGYIGATRILDQRVGEALRRLGRRGPDHACAKTWDVPGGTATLLHTRLSIIDLDPRSHQPMARGHRWIVFNGELYNYVELKEDLKCRGRTFATGSDTEVVLALWEEEGPAALDRMEGMWAFAVFNEEDGSVTLVRDRFGEKPLFLWETDGGLYFGSEVKALAALAGRRPAVNPAHLRRYLVNGYKSLFKGTDTFFHGIRALPPGSWQRWTASGKVAGKTYWSPPAVTEKDMTFEEAVAGVKERLVRSVRWRLRSDVPLAFCMSGGVDSNALIAVAKRTLGHDVHGFTIVNTDRRYEERGLVEKAVTELGVRHTWVEPRREGFLDNLATLVDYHDAPVSTISYYLHWLLMGAVAARGFKISVSGTAADELFTGYYDHHLFYLASLRCAPTAAAAARRNWEREVKPFVRNPFLSDPDLFARDPGFRDHIYLKAEEFETYLTIPGREAFREERYTENILRNRMLNELFRETTPVILQEDDANAMYHSVENRSPFLDRDLFEFSLTIPTRHLVRNGRAKSVLREAVRGLVPDAVLDNPRKVGFNAPIGDLLSRRDPAVRERLLADSPVFEILRREKMAALLDNPELPNSASKFLFNIVNVKLFLEAVA